MSVQSLVMKMQTTPWVYWPMDDASSTFKDRSGNGRDVTNTTGSITARGAKIAESYGGVFASGAGCRTNSFPGGLTEYTLFGLFTVSSYPTAGNIWALGGGTSIGSGSFDSASSHMFQVDSAGGLVGMTYDSGGLTARTTSPAYTLSVNTWCGAALRAKQGTGSALWVNGAQVGTNGTMTTMYNGASLFFCIGLGRGGASPAGGGWSGSVLHTGIINKYLTDAEIGALTRTLQRAGTVGG